ncbi:hypothetical protein VPNG_10296 [Cytospora leucostoma]|uniref:ABM domain-containing protein n=1 Tax=Cytospora leucostoma TaxID=1230097 RepID=A0A423VBT6_9PEZI|nr:hypothetical protein VPNG_10296 [Cytospora leucostoma]
MASRQTYYSVSTLAVKPENKDKVRKVIQNSVVEFFTKVGKATEEQEPAAEIYRWYKVEGKDEFVFIEKFASEEDYRAHQNSPHVQGLYKEYLQYITEPFVFHAIDTSNDGIVGGFERV